MRRINLDGIEEFKPFEVVEPNGYICAIVSVEDVPEKEYLKIYYDIVEGDKKGFYTKRKKERDFEYPCLIKSYKDSALPFFKGFITAIENSNKGYKWDCDEKTLVKKKVGLVLAMEEYSKQNGDVGERIYVAEIHSIDKIKSGDFKVPELKKLSSSSHKPNGGGIFGGATKEEPVEDIFGSGNDDSPKNDGFMNIPDDADEELPF